MDAIARNPGLRRLFEFAQATSPKVAQGEIRTKDGKDVLVVYLAGATSAEVEGLARAMRARRESESLRGEFLVFNAKPESPC